MISYPPDSFVRGSMHSPAISIDDLSHAYGERRALDGVTLNVRQGALHGLLGPNGGGKSTLPRILTPPEPFAKRRDVQGVVTAMEAPDCTARLAKPIVDLKTLGRVELEDFVRAHGEPAYRGRQIFAWIYGKGATSFAEMTDLPLAFRDRLEEVSVIRHLEPTHLRTAADETTKALFRLPSGRAVEAVLIPDLTPDGSPNRLTVCVSSQVGCAMGCAFCATGLMGFQENLTAGEIYDQAWHMNALARERYGRGLSNVVYMGMGEPLLNYDAVIGSIGLITHSDGLGLGPRRITVSTVGLARRIKRLAEDDPGVNLAVSLHAPTDEQRSAIMPVNRAGSTDLSALREALETYHARTGRQVTYEYCLFEGRNDSHEDALRLADVARWVPSKINLIMYNPVDGLPFNRTPEGRLDAFIRALVREDVTVTVRRSRGQDIDAACGQLAVKSA
jgi:23S rRNA (adenine2503-C2)-methyltransferase